MYSKPNELSLESKTINGVTHYNFGYWVWTNGRNLNQINRTDYHEACHNLVYNDYEHFCVFEVNNMSNFIEFEGKRFGR